MRVPEDASLAHSTECIALVCIAWASTAVITRTFLMQRREGASIASMDAMELLQQLFPDYFGNLVKDTSLTT